MIKGVGSNNSGNQFRAGTAFVRVGYLINYSADSGGDKTTAVTKLSNLSFARSFATSSTTNGYADNATSADNAKKLNNQDASYYLNYNNFTNTPTIPTNTNQLTNGAGFVTATNHSHSSTRYVDSRSEATTPTGAAGYDGLRIDFKQKTTSGIESQGS